MTSHENIIVPEASREITSKDSTLKKDFIIRMAVKTLLVGAVLLFALYVRRYTFWLPHWKGDQNHYISLAMKLDKLGFDHFSLRGVNMRSMTLRIGPQGNIVFSPGADPGGITLIHPYLAENVLTAGRLLQSLAHFGITYYDQPFFHKPTGLPYALMLSHRLFTREDQPYVVMLANIGPDLKRNLDLRVVLGLRAPPSDLLAFYTILPIIFQAQFWAVIVPLFFSIGLILLTFFLGNYLFSYRTGLYAAFMMAINPVAIMTSQKILADDMLAFFMVLAVLLLAIALKKGCSWLAFVGGISCGIGVLAKQTSGALLYSLYFFTGFMVIASFLRSRNLENLKKQRSLILITVLFTIGVFAVSGFWFWRLYSMFGHPLWFPSRASTGDARVGWFEMIGNRPHPKLFFSIGVIYLAPLFLPFIFSIKDLFIEVYEKIRSNSEKFFFIFLWSIIAYFFYRFARWQEHRHLLPIYPYIAILAGLYFDKFRSYCSSRDGIFWNRTVRECVIVILFILCAVWSVPKGIETGIDDIVFMRQPTPVWLENIGQQNG